MATSNLTTSSTSTSSSAVGKPQRSTIRPGAPAWAGDLATLTDEQLHERIEGLGTHIGNIHTVWSASGYVVTWRAATAADLRDRELPRWVSARLDALGERERRIEAAR